MEFVCHRVNSLEELKNLPTHYGVEIDLRDGLDGKIYLEHEPFISGTDFETYLRSYQHGLIIANVKSERVEIQALELFKKYKIENFFFLDSSFPMIYLLRKNGEKRIALRISEYEGMDTIQNMAGKIKWIWVDCFTKIPITREQSDTLHSMGYRLCFVSPELEGHAEDFDKYIQTIQDEKLHFDAVCSNRYLIDKWETANL